MYVGIATKIEQLLNDVISVWTFVERCDNLNVESASLSRNFEVACKTSKNVEALGQEPTLLWFGLLYAGAMRHKILKSQVGILLA